MSNEMHPDLEWLARNVSEWSRPDCNMLAKVDGHPKFCKGESLPDTYYGNPCFKRAQWFQARKDLGLEDDVMTEEESELPAKEHVYSPYFKDVRHIDKLDVYRVIDLFGCEKHGHPISHAVKKLLLTGVRTGGKSVEKDVREAIDSLQRWLEMREEDKSRD